MITLFYKFSPRHIGVICGLVCFFGAYSAHSALLIPTSISGSISYGYGYNKTQGGGESESQSITANISGTGFIWQPWFIQGGVGLSFGFTRADSSTASSSSTSRAFGGSLSLNVFPVSRFPFSLSITHNNTQLDSTQTFGGISSYETKSTQIFARQSYYPRSGYDTNVSWAHSEVETFSSTSVSDVVNADTRKYYEKSSWVTSANYSVVDDSNSTRTPENWGVRFNHNYTPGNQASISSLLSTSGTRVTGDGFTSNGQQAQASSTFSWRPEYRPYNFSGGARIASNETRQQSPDEDDSKFQSNSASLSLGVNYQLSRKMTLIVTGSGSGSLEESATADTTTTNASIGASTSYNSDLYSFSGFQYSWNVGGGGGASYNSAKKSDATGTTDQTDDTATAGLTAGHRLARGWSVGRTTGMSFSLSQSASASGTNDGTTGWGTGFGGSLSGSTRGLKGTSFAGLTGSYSYNQTISEFEETTEIESQFMNANLSRNQTINRLSAFTANATVQWRRQQSTESETTTRSANANVNYRHQRFFGIYALNFDSIAAYNLVFNPDEDQTASMYWRNTWRYTIGLLDLSLFIDFSREGDSPTRGSLRFRATRSF